MISRQPPEAGPSIDIDAGRERRVQSMVVVGTALLVLILLASVAFAVLDQRREILSVTEMRVRNLVQVIEEQTGGSIAAVEIALAGTARTLQLLPGKIEPRQPVVHDLLRENVEKLPLAP